MSESQDSDSQPVTPSIDPARKALIDSILSTSFPALPGWEAVAGFAKNTPPLLIEMRAKAVTERERLNALPLDELKRVRARQIARKAADNEAADARRRAESEAKELKREKSRFFWKPSAFADLAYWSKFEYWTFDEAIALLFGRDPKVVTAAAMKGELPILKLGFYSSTPPYARSFVFQYAKLRELAARAEAMTKSQKLKPKDVISWALEIGHSPIPPELVALVKKSVTSEVEAPKVHALNEQLQPTPTLKKVALIKKYFREWPTIEGDLRHGTENGLSNAAKAPAHGHWFEDAAVQWAKQNGKMHYSVANIPPSLSSLPITLHKLRG
jgi:hypothetical protein